MVHSSVISINRKIFTQTLKRNSKERRLKRQQKGPRFLRPFLPQTYLFLRHVILAFQSQSCDKTRRSSLSETLFRYCFRRFF